MDCIAQGALTDDFQTPDRRALEIANDVAELGLRNQKHDVRNVIRDAVFESQANLAAKAPVPAIAPPGKGTRCSPEHWRRV